MSIRALRWLIFLLPTLSSCSTPTGVDAGADAPAADAAVPDPPVECVAGEITTQWIGEWRASVDAMSIPGVGLFTSGYDGDITVERIDITGERAVIARLPSASGQVRLIAGNRPRVALVSSEGVEVRTLLDAPGYGSQWRVESPNVRWLASTAGGGVAVLSDHTSQPLSYETYDASGNVAEVRTPVEIDGIGRLYARPDGDPMISVHTAVVHENFVGNAGGDFQPMEGSCEIPSTALLPLEGDTFVWAEACRGFYDGSLTLSVWSGAELVMRRVIDAPRDSVQLSRGPDETILVAASGPGGTALLLLDASTLEERASGELHAEETSEFDFTEVKSATDVESGLAGLVALGHDADVPAARLVLARVCPSS